MECLHQILAAAVAAVAVAAVAVAAVAAVAVAAVAAVAVIVEPLVHHLWRYSRSLRQLLL